MALTVSCLAERLSRRIPAELSESWDNDGIMVLPDGDAEVTGVLCALDCTTVAIAEAAKRGCNVIVTHHPLLFRPVGRLTVEDSVGKRVVECVRSGIAVLSYHTRLDSLPGGVNDCLAEKIGLKNTEAFLPFARIGDVEEQPFEQFASHVSAALGVRLIQCVKSNPSVRRVALVSGSGKDEIRTVLAAGADTFVTGEVMHNHLIDCKEYGLNLICATHFATERIVIPALAALVREAGARAEEFSFDERLEYGI